MPSHVFVLARPCCALCSCGLRSCGLCGACVSPPSQVYGSELIAAGVPAEVLSAWSSDPALMFEGSKQSLFDLHEDLDAPACTARAIAVLAENPAV